MPESTTFRSPSRSDSAILDGFRNIGAELGQEPKQCRVAVVVMAGYPDTHNIPLSKIRSRALAQHAQQHKTASWERVWIDFPPLHLEVKFERPGTGR